MKNRRNYYRILHVQPDASPAVVRASYRTLMQKLKTHPDLGGDEWNARCLNEAYAVISDPVRRARYDRENGFDFPRTVVRETASPVADRTPGKPAPDNPSGSLFAEVASRSDATVCPFCGATQVNFQHKGMRPPCSHCRSPQQPPVRDNVLHTAERSVWRASQEQNIRFYTSWPQAAPHCGQVTDLSPKGLGIRAPLNLEADAIIKIDGEKLQAVVRILNCKPAQTGGVREFRASGRFVTLEFSTVQGNFVSVKT